MKQAFYAKGCDETLQEVGSSREGLSTQVAEERLAQNGKNKLAEGKKTPIWRRFLQQLADPMIIILICAAVISGITSAFGEEKEYADIIIIMAVVLINAILGVVQESKAEAAIEALKQMTAATTKVIRDGKQVLVKSEDLVVGDIIVLEAGDAVPADARLLTVASLKCEESAMTGESVPVNKHADAIVTEDGRVPLGDRKNMVFMGSTAVYGRGVAVVVATGMDTEMGKIAGALSDAENEKTPLQIKLAQLSKILTYLVLGICGVIFIYNIIAQDHGAGNFFAAILSDSLIPAVSLAVAAIPEGLAAVVTIQLSIGVTRMSKQGAVIRKLSAVETLGCTQIICSDKTGTLTQNKMTVVDNACAANVTLLATAMALCSDSKPDENGEAQGEPTENALVNYAYKMGLNKYDLEAATPRIGEIPFDSGRKLMTTVHQTAEGYVQYTKGAPDVLLGRCTHYLTEDGVQELTDATRAEILAANKAMADKALRVLSCGYRTYEAQPAEEDYVPEQMEAGMIFCGLVGMIDPIRPEVKAAITECRSAGIRAVMITGDHKDTAVAIAMELGIIDDPSQAITGAELDLISDEDFAEEVVKYSVYARVQPEHKTRIVKAWKARGKVTAMTGDGVNDAPSIKSADIGVGMGITGTDVTKNVADMVLSDDNFATIVKAAEEGRRIYDNIRRAIRFLLSSNMAEVIAVFVATMLGFTILRPTHLLWINLITDSFPARALGMEHAESNIMHRPPRDKKEGILSGGLGTDVVYQGVMVGILTLAAYFIGHLMEVVLHGGGLSTYWATWQDSPDGVTMAFLTMSMAEIFHSYNMRSERGSIFGIKSHNKYLFAAMAFSFVMTAAVIYVPFLRDMFKFTSIDFVEYAVAIGIALLVIPTVEIVKVFQRARARKKNAA
ncbi:MAG: cation-translocating P-type ATPase [Clostridia bacterium]|nr:cation-translocating P-type ATPase [Clostridia bacterium]